ncbi:hypothetical protein [Croceicoccus sp. Ery5]|uniref:hypothetical protein n=1 Tax=Croceicoccus sp. Ery5 TaxID=1703340 RepID=UPI001E5C2A9F|nr:hypothetical protein [Croceicoccus sp. Ery5]
MADPAAGRFFAMQIARMGGVAMAVYGMLVAASDVPWPDGLPRWLGFVLLAVGMADALLVPRMMAKTWNSEALIQKENVAREMARKEQDRSRP